jgi:hypothetical protein
MEFGDGGAEGREVGAGVGVTREGERGDVAEIVDCESLEHGRTFTGGAI